MLSVDSQSQLDGYRESPEEYAKRHNISRMTVYRMCRAGKLAAVKVGQQWRIDPEASMKILGLQR